LPLAADDENQAFFNQMIGNFYRYAAENCIDSYLIRIKEEGLKAYIEADRLT